MASSENTGNTAVFRIFGEGVAVNAVLAVIIAALVTLVLVFSLGGPLSSIEERAGSLPWLLVSDTTPEERIAIVSIDERSIAAVGSWPWSWEVIADLVVKINEAGAQLQIHDILYPAGERAYDTILLASLTEQERSIIAQLPILQSQSENIQTGTLTHSASGISCQVSEGAGQFPQAVSFIGSSNLFSSVPKGHIAPIIDSDGSVRRIPAMVCVDGKAFPALALAPFFQLVGAQSWQAEMRTGPGIFSPDQILTFDSYPGLEVPLDRDGAMRISFRKSPSAFRSISAVDILNGNFQENILDNVLVLVGATAFGLDDIVPTPYSGYSLELSSRRAFCRVFSTTRFPSRLLERELLELFLVHF